MGRIINRIDIDNFKSIESVTLDDCRTYNLLLGSPNVGKSNILEALSLFDVPYLLWEKRELSEMVRYQHSVNELFHDGNSSQPITVKAGEYQVTLTNVDGVKLNWTTGKKEGSKSLTLSNGKFDKKTKADNSIYPIFKRYIFNRFDRFTNSDIPFLLPVGGENIMQVIQNNASLTNEASELANRYGLQLLFDTSTREIRFQKKLGENTVFSIPFFSISDTLQRLLFYKSAIASNRNSVILLEEIEAHAYPPYISKITGSILDNDSNQYFITTHSPYVVNDFLERQDKDLAIFLIDLDKECGCTVVRRLSEAEVEEVYNDGIDLFFNSKIFLEK